MFFIVGWKEETGGAGWEVDEKVIRMTHYLNKHPLSAHRPESLTLDGTCEEEKSWKCTDSTSTVPKIERDKKEAS